MEWITENYIEANLLVLGIVASFSFIAWLVFGRDPKERNPYPQFKPPKDISAGLARYVYKMSCDTKLITTILTSLATKGYIDIAEYKDQKNRFSNVVRIRKTDFESSVSEKLSPDEDFLFKNLFKKSEHAIIFDRSLNSRLKDLKNKTASFFSNTYGQKYFNKNKVVFLFLVIIAITLSTYVNYVSGVTWLVGLNILFLVASGFIIYLFIESWRNSFKGSGKYDSIGNCLMIVPYALPLFLCTIYSFSYLEGFVALFPLLNIPILMFAAYALKVRTKEGRDLLDYLIGFNFFINATEKERQKLIHNTKTGENINEAEMTKLFPYAIALDYEVDWVERLNDSLEIGTRKVSPDQSISLKKKNFETMPKSKMKI